MATSVSFNVLWILCIILLLGAFYLAIRRRRRASRQAQSNSLQTETTFVRDNGQEVRIHMNTTILLPTANARQANINSQIQPPPPAFDPDVHEPPPPPSYQDFRKDVQIYPPTN